MSGLTDFHTHILPGVDDGSRNLEMSLSMLQMEAEQGVEAVVATPHFYARHDTPDRFLDRRRQAEEPLRAAMDHHGGLPALYVGAEVAYYRGMSESDVLQKLCIAGSNYILVEMPMASWEDTMYEELYQIHSRQGLIPIVAHIDRYLMPFQVGRMMRRLEELPVLVQANAEFFTNRRTEKTAMKLLRNEQIHLLGSDCHNLSDRKPNLGDAVQQIKRYAGSIFVQKIQGNCLKILKDFPYTNPVL